MGVENFALYAMIMNISSEAAGKTRGPVFSGAPRNVLRRAAILVASPLAL